LRAEPAAPNDQSQTGQTTRHPRTDRSRSRSTMTAGGFVAEPRVSELPATKRSPAMRLIRLAGAPIEYPEMKQAMLAAAKQTKTLLF